MKKHDFLDMPDVKEYLKQFYIEEPNTGCWLWIGSFDKNKGYGNINGYNKTFPAHVVVWEVYNKRKIPAGFKLHHKCLVKPCVNPDHTEPVTNAKNVALNPKFLSDLQVLEIKNLYESGDWTQRDLALKFGVGQTTIQQYVTNKTRSWLTK